MRSSPDRTRTIPRAVFGSARASSVASSSALRAGPDAASIAANVAATSTRPGDAGLVRGVPAFASTSPTAALMSEKRSYAAEVAAIVPATLPTAFAMVAQPMPVARWSASGKGRPVRNTTAIGSSSASRVRRYSARSASSPTSGSWRRRARRARSSAACGRWYTVPPWAAPHGFPSGWRGIVVLQASGERRRSSGGTPTPRSPGSRATRTPPCARTRSTASSSSGRSATSR